MTTSGHLPAQEQRKPVWVDKLALTELYKPENQSTIVADVLLVHGLGGHPYKTWRFKGKVENKVLVEGAESSKVFGMPKKKQNTWKTISEKKRLFWPLDLLPDDISDVRILTYGHDSSVSHGVHGPTNRSNISQLALSLLNAVTNARLDCRDRPLILVAHSLGGLLVKQAVVESWKAEQDRQDRDLHRVCHAAIFLGTPHRGSPDASWGRVCTAIAKVAQFDVNNAILRDLDPSSGSPTLQMLQDDFLGIVRRGNIKIYTFQEGAGKTGFAPFSGKVVPDESSSFAGRDIETRDTINQNHMEMCRFRGRQDDGYKKVLGAINGFLKTIVSKKGHEEQVKEIERQALLERLDFAERSVREQHIDTADARDFTFVWVWKIEETHSSFTNWLQKDEPMFWIQGKPGSGKSTLMHYLSKTDRVETMLTSASKFSSWQIIWFFFDYSAGKGIANNFEGFLRSLCFQIADQVPSVTSVLKENAVGAYASKFFWSIATLRKSLIEMLQQTSENLCILVDGLDEYRPLDRPGDDLSTLISFLHGLPSKSNVGALLKICLASRPEPIASLTLEHLPGFRMQDHNERGIETYVSNTIQETPMSASHRYRLSQFSAPIAEKAEGVFLWARFAVSEILDSYSEGDSVDETQKRLDGLPSAMIDLYDNIFQRMKETDRNEAKVMFQLICSAIDRQGQENLRRLTLRQLKEAEGIARGVINHSELEDSGDTIADFGRRLRSKCRGLLEEVACQSSYKRVEWNPIQGRGLYKVGLHFRGFRYRGVKLIHRSAKEFLESRKWLQSLEIGTFKFTSPDALWVHVCCKYIQMMPEEAILAKTSSRQNDERSKGHQISLFEYVMDCLFYHARNVEQQYLESSFKSLTLIPCESWRKLRMQFNVFSQMKMALELPVNWKSISSAKEQHPWQIMIEQGLELCVKDALSIASHRFHPYHQDITIAFHTLGLLRIQDSDKERSGRLREQNTEIERPVERLLSVLIEHGAPVRDMDIIICIFWGSLSLLRLLMTARPPGKLVLTRKDFIAPSPLGDLDCYYGDSDCSGYYDSRDCDYGGECVGPLWELGRSHSWEFQPMLDFFLDRGEGLNDRCGPGGPLIHALIIKASHLWSWHTSSQSPEQVSIVIERGADVDIVGPHGTPLAMAWKILRFGNLIRMHHLELRHIMGLLKRHGANCSWIEPNGTVVSEEEIDTLIREGVDTEKDLHLFEDKTPGWYNWDILFKDDVDSSFVSEYMRSMGTYRPKRPRTWLPEEDELRAEVRGYRPSLSI